MAIKAVLDSLDGVPEELHDSYKKEGDKWVLDFDAIRDHPGVAKVKQTADSLDREKRDALRQMQELQERFDGLDPDKAREALRKMEEAGDQELLDAGKVEELLEKKTERMKQDFESQLAAKDQALQEAQAKLDTMGGELQDIKIYDAIKDAALAKGARKEALQDIKNRAQGTWKLDDQGKPVAMNGDDPMYGKNGERLTIDEWVSGLSKEAGYLFEPNTGGGAPGGNARPAGGPEGVKVITKDAAGDNLAAIAKGEAVIDRG